MQNYSIIGKRVPRLDAKEKATGKAKYAGDIVLPMMLYGKVLRSTYPHARIIKIDTSKAEQLIGVKAVVTAKDVPNNRWGTDRQDDCVMAADKVRYIGDEVAGIAAVDEDLAEEALSLISVEYEELPAVFDPEEAMKPGAPKVHDDMEDNIVLDLNILRGDIERGFEEADVIVEDNFITQPVIHCHIEPVPCLTDWDANSKLTIWIGSMWPAGVQANLAQVLEVPLSKVRVINCHVGGAFGNRVRMLRPYAICALLSKKAGRPVRIVNTREEEFMTTRHRTGTKFYMKLGAKKDGTITAEQSKVIADNGAYAYNSQKLLIGMCLRSDAIYRFTNVKWEAKMVYTNKAMTANFRGFGSAQPTFVREQMMDILAEKLGMDTVELKLRNAIRTGDITVHGWPINSCGLSECIQKTAEVAGWREKRAKKIPGRGIGIASMVHETDMRFTDGFGGTTAFVKLLEDGRVNVMIGEPEVGQGGYTSYAMVVAEEMGIPLGNIEVIPIDTDFSPYGLGPFGSKWLMTGCNATRLAALDANRQILKIASEMLKVKVEKLQIGDQQVSVIGMPEKSVSLSDVAKYATYGRGGSAITGKGIDERNTENTFLVSHPTHYGNAVSASYFDTVAAEVEVNPETGDLKVLNLIVADDCGKVINLQGLEGQIQGATAQGIGNTFLEERICHKGRMLNSTFMSYHLPTAMNIPPIKIILVESNEPEGAYGCKGGGENPGIDSTAPAVANAIYNAIGVRIKDLPITPDKILKALEEKRRLR